MFSPSAAAIFCFSSISSTVEIKSRRPAACFELRIVGCLAHASAQIPSQILVASFQEQLHVANGRGVRFVVG